MLRIYEELKNKDNPTKKKWPKDLNNYFSKEDVSP